MKTLNLTNNRIINKPERDIKRSTIFFSLIIPTLNEEKYLPKLLNCLTKQIEKKLKLLSLMVKARIKPRPGQKISETFYNMGQNLLIVNADKRNVSYQRNLGAKYAQGKY